MLRERTSLESKIYLVDRERTKWSELTLRLGKFVGGSSGSKHVQAYNDMSRGLHKPKKLSRLSQIRSLYCQDVRERMSVVGANIFGTRIDTLRPSTRDKECAGVGKPTKVDIQTTSCIMQIISLPYYREACNIRDMSLRTVNIDAKWTSFHGDETRWIYHFRK